ncbi:MAG: hypothetical protein ACLGGV_03880 [Bacteroidia bacterium]
MNFIKSIANDLLNGLSIEDIPVFLARIFFAGLVAFVFKMMYYKKHPNQESSIIKHLVSLSVAVCVVVPIAQFSISLGLILAAFIVGLFVNIKSNNTSELVFLFLSFLFSASIGAGYVVYSIVGLIPLLILLLIAKK